MGKRNGACLCVAVALLATTFAVAPVAAQAPSVLRVAMVRGLDSVNPFLSTSLAGTEVGRLEYEYLVDNAARDFAPVPGLAESWRVEPDGRTWVFSIRSGARWSDGVPITARDPAFTFTLMLTNEVARTANGNFVADLESATAPDDRTLVLRTKKPQATMLALDVPIVPEHVWSKVGDLEHFPNDTGVVASGPFVLSENRHEEFLRFTANPLFWRGRPKIDELRLLRFDTMDAAVEALRRGEVDLLGDGLAGSLTPAQFDGLRAEPGVTVHPAAGRRLYELTMNPGAATRDGRPIGDGQPALTDVRVRQAIAYAMDNQKLVDAVLRGHGTPGDGGYLPPATGDVHWAPEDRRPFDPDRADHLLDEAGYPRGPDGARRNRDGHPLTLRLYGRSDRYTDAAVGEYVRGWLAGLGIGTDLRIMDSSRLNDLVGDGEFDLAFSGWSVSPDPDYVLSVQTCGRRPSGAGTAGSTDTFFCDQRYDQLYEQQLAELDHAKRVELIRQAEKRWYEQVPAVVLYYPDSLEAYRGDRFAPLQQQPDPNGALTGQSGYWGYLSATPLAPEHARNPVAWWWVAGGALVAAIAVGLVLAHRRRTTPDRE